VVVVSLTAARVVADDAKRATPPQATGRITIDGALEESDWARAASIGEIVQREPRPGAAASERTEVKLLYDARNLYIGVVCYDSEPDKIIGTQMARDAALMADDTIEILIDTFHDRRNAFYFATNPLGALVDGLIIENGQPNKEWDAIWTVKTRRFAEGWSAEFEIPFKSLGFNKGQNIWGFNFSRTIRRKIEEDRWAAPRLDVKFYQASEAGEIEVSAEIEQGRGLDVRPYFAGRWTHDSLTGNDVVTGKGGGEIFYNITPNLKWTTTFNTDFAETEVDNRQINLTRFPLFFPEKRAFFLENAGAFSFANTSFQRLPDVLPFFSRRIGLINGQEVPILAGTKLTGKVGRYDVGALGVRTREAIAGDRMVEAKNLFVGRVKRNIFKQSYIGGIYTEGNPNGTSSSRTFGGDLRLATSEFLGSARNFAIEAHTIKTSNKDLRGDDLAYGFSVSYPNDKLDAQLTWRHIGRDFNPALGFVARPGVNLLSITSDYNPRPKRFLNVRQMFHEFRFFRYSRSDTGESESWRLFTAPVNWTFNSGDRVEFNWTRQFERLFQPFEIADGVTLPTGKYEFTRYRLEFWTAAKRRWRFEGTWWFGGFYSGHSDQFEVAVEYKLAPHFQVALETDQTFARLKEGVFIARIFALRLNYSFSPFLSVSNLIQFDNESRNLGWQSRVRWIIKPGNDLFLVFNQGWEQNARGGFNFLTTGTRLAGKIQYTFRF